MDAVVSAPENVRRRRARARFAVIAGAVATALVTGLLGAVPAQAADAIVPPEQLAILGDLRVGEVVTVPAEGWTPVDTVLSVDWYVDDVKIDDEVEAQTPLDLTLLP